MSHENKKILFVLPSLAGGGAEKFVIRLSNALAERGFNTSLLIITNNSNDYLKEISSRVSLFRLNQKKEMGVIFPLRSFFKQHKPDVIFSTMTYPNVLCLIAKILSRINSEIYVRSANVFSFNNDGFKNKIIATLAKLLYPLASGVISLSQDVHNESIKLGIKNKHMAIIYNFVDKVGLQQLATMPTDQPENFTYPFLLSVGRLAKQKNHAYLIQGFHAFLEQYNYPNAKLIILGKGPEQARLEQLISEFKLQDKVILKGFLKNPYPYFAKTDLFVHTARAEGLGNVLLAALALEANIVATDCPGPVEILANGTYGRLIPRTGDPDILAKAMHDALQNPIDKALLSNSVASFSVEIITQQYIDFMGLNSNATYK